MTNTKRITIFALCIMFVVSVIALLAIDFGESRNAYASEVFDYVGAIKAEVGSVEGTKRGLRLYGYDNGVKANFKNAQTGVFNAELQIASHDGKKDLKKYSLLFTDRKSGKSFAAQVVAYSDYSDVGVIYGGNKGGVVYLERNNAAYGLTAGYNADGVYTRFTADVCALTFDPSSMQIKVKADDGNFRVVWDFTEQFNDGKLLANDLPLFGEYTVSVVFDEISANSRGDLMLYSFGGYSLTEETVEYRPAILLQKGLNPVVGKEFTLPTAKLTDGKGNDVSDKIKTTVYDGKGNLLAENVKSFIPATKQTIYVYYSYESGFSADAWYKAEVIKEADITAKFTYDGDLPDKTGVGAKLRIPDATVASNVLGGGKEDCVVSIKKDGVLLDGYQNLPGGTEFEVKEKGNYEIVYGGKTSFIYKTETKCVNADENTLAVNVKLVSEFALGSTYNPPVAEFCLGKAKTTVSPVVTYPSGKVADGELKLDEVGKYQIAYDATIGAESHTYKREFTVKMPYADNFDSAAEYARMRGNNELQGVKLTLTNNRTITYGKEIDFSEYTFDATSNRGKTLAEFNFDPNTIGSNDLDSFYMVFTDKYDQTNYFTVRFKYLSYSPMCTYIRARASNQASWVGYYYDFFSAKLRVDSAAIHEEGGFVSSGSFTHKLDEYDFAYNGIKLYFDYKTKCLYAQPLWLTGHDGGGHPEYNATKVPWLVYDFDSPDNVLSAGNRPWNGFTTGEAYLSVYAKGVGTTAEVFALNVGGESLTSPLFDDTKAPEIKIDVDKNEIPTAKVGVPFKVFGFTATDADSPIIKKGFDVTFNATGKQVDDFDENNRFTPKEGKYTITYYAVDAFGYRAEEKIIIEAKRNVEKPAITVLGELPSTAYYGQTVDLPDYEITKKGAGNASVDVKVTCRGKDIPVTNGKFVCLGAVGVYNVDYIVTDYIGQSAAQTKTIAVSLSDELQFNEDLIRLPEAFIKGDKVYFGEYYAVYYGDNLEKTSVPAKVTVTDSNGKITVKNGEAYVPAATDEVSDAKVTFLFDNGKKTKTVERVVPVKTIKNGDDFMVKYFNYSNATPSSSSNGVTFTNVISGEMDFSFIRPVYAKNMMLRFILDADNFKAESFNLTFTDKFNGTRRVKISYTLTGKIWSCSVNGAKAVETSFNGDGYLQLNYDDATRTFTDGNGQKLGVADKTDGEEFRGFESGYVYLSCAVNGIYDKTTVGIRTINNQTINSVKRDIQSPYVKADGNYEGRIASGSTVTLISASCYDVISAVGDITVSVKLGNKTILKEKTLVAGETFKAEECGTYTITYKVVDSAKNAATDKIEFAVYDPVRPTLVFDGKIPDKAEVGQKITLPDYEIKDNKIEGVKVYIYVLAPDGTKFKPTGKTLTFNQKGVYAITYLVTDEFNNVNLYRFIVTVK